MSDLIKKLEEYFATTPREKVLEDWEKSKEWDKVGPTVDEFLRNNNRIWVEQQQVIYKYVRLRRRPSLLQQRRLNKIFKK